MAAINNIVQRYPLITVAVALVVIAALMATTIHGQVSYRSAEAKFTKLVQNIDRAAFTSRCGTPLAVRLTESVVSLLGRLMHEGDFNHIVAHVGSQSVQYYYRRPGASYPGALVNDVPTCATMYRDQFIY
ncbi:MAG: hypothetical protein HYT39_04115 [Candidatus Sungbacteria bacterium]|nr:hypothetical protein [Candidatus Sungbacteria bacterium]